MEFLYIDESEGGLVTVERVPVSIFTTLRRVMKERTEKFW